MTASPFAGRIVTAPTLPAAEPALARITAWLDGLPAALALPLRNLLAANPPLGRLLAGVSEYSPFLWSLIGEDVARLHRILDADPDRHLAGLLAETVAAMASVNDDAEAMRLLRRMKAEAALLIALADIGGVWPLTRITRAISELADTAVGAATRFALAEAVRDGRLNAAASGPQCGSGFVVIAMGKMGAFELNYSSDIDLIVLFDASRAALPEGDEAAPLFVRITQRMVRLLSQRTADGYVFRVDLRLRPDPSSTGIAISTSAALSYYESRGQNWERAAMIKARPCAGDIAACEHFLQELSPFVWRKYLDYVAVADIHAMKRQIEAFRGVGAIAIEGHNIKLGRGGIREIEFFAQTQQLIAGGRNSDLRDRDTLTALDKLHADRWIGAEARDQMKAAYVFLRTVEHRLQMVADEQTQTLPPDRDGLERFSRFLGFAGRDAFAGVLRAHLENVQRHYARLFEHADGDGEIALSFPADADDRKALDRLAALGFRNPLEASATVRQWLAGGHRALKGEVAQSQLRELLPALVKQIARTDHPDATLVLFDRFFGNLIGAPRLLSLLRQNPELTALVTLVLGAAPRLADTLARHPQVMDSLVDPGFFGALPDTAELGQRLEQTLTLARYEEDRLERIRLFGLEYMFLTGVRVLSGTATALQAGDAFARLAEAIVGILHGDALANLAAAYGQVRGGESAILALGKLGGLEMTAASDLDLIVIYDFDERHPESDGRRPLYGGQYFARLTQRLINALAAQTNHGALYHVDMRLRPSGRAGPLATHIGAFKTYQEREAWTWEHMALTRARAISGAPEFRARVEQTVREILCLPRDSVRIAGDVAEMRRAIAQEKGDDKPWDLKYAAGGLVDIEFIAQYLQLINAHRLPQILDTNTARVLDRALELGVLPIAEAEVLRPAIRFFQDLTQIQRLCIAGPFEQEKAGPGVLALLARAGGVPDFATLEATLVETQAKVRRSFERILGQTA